ncbi:hypothetical protein QBC38DRAFT_489073 [Podospora fimiseda]|uniref:Uncharacterized protein n=1 Tax=Podospora fimiseda TaxID=252190 RepID=A0AAN6YRT7_9PEZI|nr:hypothetical protein QBC38DRAFT_489073 [Podospora fimiseda]
MQATTNCLSQITTAKSQTDLFLTALNADLSDLAKYSNPQRLLRWQTDPNTNQEYLHEPSPSNLDTAAERGRALGQLAADIYWTTAYLSANIGYRGLDTLAGPIIRIIEPGSKVSGFLTDLLGDGKAFSDYMADVYEKEARENPYRYLGYDELNGICFRYSEKCTDKKTGIPYLNENYNGPKDTPGSEKDPGKGPFELPGLELNLDPTLPDDDLSGVDPNGPESGEIIEGSDGVLVTIDPDADPEAFLKACVKKEEAALIRSIGTTRIAIDEADSGPVTEVEKREDAERKLMMGMCDKEYFGKEYCDVWKQERWRVPVTPEMQQNLQTMQAIRFAACPRPGAGRLDLSCDKARKELDKRYVVDDLGVMVVGALFPAPQSPILKVAPLRINQAAWRPEKNTSSIFLPPVKVAAIGPITLPSVTRIGPPTARLPPFITLTTTRRPLTTPKLSTTIKIIPTRILTPTQ